MAACIEWSNLILFRLFQSLGWCLRILRSSSSARSMFELCDLTGELWSCLPDHLTRHLQNAVLVEKPPQRDHSVHSANLGWWVVFFPPSTLFAAPSGLASRLVVSGTISIQESKRRLKSLATCRLSLKTSFYLSSSSASTFLPKFNSFNLT